MSLTGARSGGVDLLARTTLMFHEATSVLSIANLVRALQSVPGVLLAEIDAGRARATVAHDAGVATASLVAAALRAGVHVKIVDDRPVPTPDEQVDPPRTYRRFARMIAVAVAACIGLTILEIAAPKLAQWLVPTYAISLGLFMFLETLSRRTRS